MLSNHHLIGLYEQSVALELDQEFLDLILSEIKRRNLKPYNQELTSTLGQI
ncbi:sporulation histidine kinase inhibitor Sda [Paenibacillus senegalensis]|uniref:sporulation histidine kinase inhibitor Sda n=1 Tax=Paenibacillus senegalensis TaxID=1465766 RepID=UPI003709B057